MSVTMRVAGLRLKVELELSGQVRAVGNTAERAYSATQAYQAAEARRDRWQSDTAY